MKASVVALCLISALAFALAAIAQFAGSYLLQAFPTSALVGGLASAGVLAVAFCDYSRKPSFRVRRPSAHVTNPALDESQPTDVAQLDWTYAPHAA